MRWVWSWYKRSQNENYEGNLWTIRFQLDIVFTATLLAGR